jgi:hypothetical protein
MEVLLSFYPVFFFLKKEENGKQNIGLKNCVFLDNSTSMHGWIRASMWRSHLIEVNY